MLLLEPWLFLCFFSSHIIWLQSYITKPSLKLIDIRNVPTFYLIFPFINFSIIWHSFLFSIRRKLIQSDLQQNNTRRRTQKIIWFNQPFSLNAKGNVAKMFLQLIDTHFPTANKLHKIFNRNTVKVSYSCTQNIFQIIKEYNKNLHR